MPAPRHLSLHVALLAVCSACDGVSASVPADEAAPSAVAEAVHRAREGRQTEGRPAWQGRHRLSDGLDLVVDGQRLVWDRVLTEDLVANAVVDETGARFAFAERVDGGPQTRVWACQVEQGCRVRWAEGHPDRLAIAPAGDQLAWVASVDGLPVVQVAGFEGGEPISLTNIGLDRSAPGRPAGFVPPPHDGPVRFERGRIVWSSPEGAHQVVLP